MPRVRSRPRRAEAWWAPGTVLACLIASTLASILSLAVDLDLARGQSGALGDLANTYYGDRVVSQTTPEGERITLLLGNARFTRADLEVRGDRARFFHARDLIEVVGEVEAQSDSMTLWADSLRIFRRTDTGRAWGDVRVETLDGTKGRGERGHYRRADDWLALVVDARVIDDDYVIEGDSISYERRRGLMRAFGDVQIVDEENRSIVRGERAVFDRNTGVAVVDSVPVFLTRRGDGPLTRVQSQWMSFDEESRTSTAIGSVDFRQGSTEARADTARFVGEDELVMRGSPTVRQQGRVMEGSEIRFHYVDGALDLIEVFGQASLVDSTPDTLARGFANVPLANTLSGDTLRIRVVEGEIVRTTVRGSARSVYLPEDQAAAISVNEVEGDAIDIRFRDGRVHDVDVTGSVKGVYRYLERRAIARLDSASAELDSTAAAGSDSSAAAGILATNPAPGDSTVSLAAGPADSTAAAAADSAAIAAAGLIDFRGSAQSVDYVGKTTRFRVPEGRIHIQGEGQVRYDTLELYADDIYFDTKGSELLAEGSPRLVDRESELIGERMGYLFDPRTGAAADGATRFDDGFYFFDDVRRIDDKTLLVRDGVYTTCELEEPHYHFTAKRMKLRVGEQVVARQVTLHLSDIPLITLPFFYKDLKTGRRSGILFPNLNLGVSSREGRYVRDFGYYWATNEYTDFKFEFDYNERRELTAAIDNVYNKRNAFDGDVRFSYTRKFEQPTEFGSSTVGDEWRLDARHSQPELFDVWRASAEVSMSSSSLTRNNPRQNTNVDLIDSQLRSRATVSRSFDNGSSLNLGLNRTQWVNARDQDFANNNDLSNLTGSLSLSFRQGPIVGGRKRPTSNPVANFLRDVTFRQSYSGNYDRALKERSLRQATSVRGNFGLSYVPDPIGPLRLTSSANFSETWRRIDERIDVYTTITDTLPDSTVVTRNVIDEEASTDEVTSETLPTLTFSNGLSTKIYGLFTPRLGRVHGIRHIVDVSGTHNFTPELGDQQRRSQSVALRMSNAFSLKILERDRDGGAGADAASDTSAASGSRADGGEPAEPRYRKLDQFVVWDLSTSVDPEADPGAKWRDIQSSVTLRPGITNAIDFSMNQTIDPYAFDVTSTRFNSSLRLRGTLDLGGMLLKREQRENRFLARLPDAPADTSAIDPDDPDLDPWEEDALQRQQREEFLESGDRNAIPWDLYVRGSLTQTQLDGDRTDSRASLSARANLGLPGDWKLSWSADFDVEAGEFNNQFWRLSRRLHHWRLEFSRGLTDAQDFGFSIYLDTIPDLRVDRGDRARNFGVRDRLDSAF